MSQDGKSVRALLGYTREEIEKQPEAWLSNAEQFYFAALLLSRDQSDRTARPFYLVAGLSLEILLKSIAVRRGLVPLQTHSLAKLCESCEIEVSDDEKLTLELLTEAIFWLGRYPVPKRDEDWDNYHDHVLEGHLLRSSEGNVYTTRANPKTFPNKENYVALWGRLRNFY